MHSTFSRGYSGSLMSTSRKRWLPALYSALLAIWLGVIMREGIVAVTLIFLATVLVTLHISLIWPRWTFSLRSVRFIIFVVGLLGIVFVNYTKSLYLWPTDIAVGLRYPNEPGFENFRGPSIEWADIDGGEPIRIILPASNSRFVLRLGIRNKHQSIALENALFFVTFLEKPRQVRETFPWQVLVPNQTFVFQFSDINPGTSNNAQILEIGIDHPGRYLTRVTISSKNAGRIIREIPFDITLN